jgi:hypothetical protein
MDELNGYRAARAPDHAPLELLCLPMGIYYDDPGNLMDATNQFRKVRASAGFLVTISSRRAGVVQYFRNFDKSYQILDLPRVKSVHGTFPFRIPMLSNTLGAMKFYPAILEYMGKEKAKNEHMFQQTQGTKDAGGSIELTVGNTIHFHFPLEERPVFYAT